jgi:hypothetical protein
LSAAIVMIPLPDADVTTGGVSSAPVKVTFKSTAKLDPLNAMSAAAATKARTRGRAGELLMINSLGWYFTGLTGQEILSKLLLYLEFIYSCSKLCLQVMLNVRYTVGYRGF